MSVAPPSSRIAGFYKLSVAERLGIVGEFAGLSPTQREILRGNDPERLNQAARMIENVGGLFHLPVGFAVNFRLDGRDRLVPMVIEEPSVVAAASNAAKLLRGGVGIETRAESAIMIGQVQLCDVPNLDQAMSAIEASGRALVAQANASQSRLVARGGGARSLRLRRFDHTPAGPMLIVHLLVDVCDAMGANLVNSMVETIAPELERLSGANACLRILSNLADERLVHALGRIPLEKLSRPALGLDGEAVADRIVRASAFAEVDPYRAATHNKGIMNGVDAFLLATGQDWRAVEAGVHAYAANEGHYKALATWRREGTELVGRITLPMQVGSVGGVIRVHPVVPILLQVAQCTSANDIGQMAAAVGLAQNLAAILALATEGIQRGHMSLHARNIAAAAGARDDRTVASVVAEMIRRRTINLTAAESIIREQHAPASDPQSGALSMSDVSGLKERYWPEIELLLKRLAPSTSDGIIGEMFWYWMGTGGKRLRALLPLAVYEALGKEPADIVPFAAATELLHNATLVHADAETRRKRRRQQDTVWARYGIDQAINLGDYMLYLAIRCLDALPHGAEKVRRLSRLVVDDLLRTVAAQSHVRDTQDERPEELEVLANARDRVGSLLGLAVTGPSALAGMADDDIAQLERIGGHLGILFRVQDDLVDLTKVEPTRTEISAHPTLLTDHVVRVAPPEIAAELRAIITNPASRANAETATRVVQLLKDHGAIDHAFELIAEHQGAVDALASTLTPPSLVGLLQSVSRVFLAPLTNVDSGPKREPGPPQE